MTLSVLQILRLSYVRSIRWKTAAQRGITATNAGYSMYNRKEFNYIRVTDVLLGSTIDLRANGLQFKYVPSKAKR